MKLPWATEGQKFAGGAVAIWLLAAVILFTVYGCAHAEPLVSIPVAPELEGPARICVWMYEGKYYVIEVHPIVCKGYTPL